MYTRDDFWKSLVHETNVIKHLATKVPEGGLTYRPTPGQRSTLELMQFMATMGIGGMRSILEEGWKAWEALDAVSKSVTAENFASMMDKQLADMQVVFAKFTDEELAKEIDLYGIGMKMPKKAYLFEGTLKWFVGYKMQLFLYAKAAGNSKLGTANLWQGRDMPVKDPI